MSESIESIENDPPRLRDDPTLSPAIGSAIAAGRGYVPSAGARARTLAAMGVGAAVATATSATSATATFASPGAAKVLLGWKAWVVTFGVVAIGGGSYVALRSQSSQSSQSRPSIVASAAPTNPTAGGGAGPATPASTTPEAAPSEEIPAIVGSANPAKAPVAKVKGASSTDTLAAEIAAIDAARNALRSGDAKGALTLLDAYGRDFPKGSFGLEAQVLRIEALAAAGQREKARVLAERFLATHPNSVLAPRVRAVLGP